jgi:hypothetical protein
MQNPLLVEVIAYAPTAFYHCTHCETVFRETRAFEAAHTEQLQNSLPEDLKSEYQQLSDWIRQLAQMYCDRIAIRVIDAASPEGFIKSLRYRVRRYPAFIIDHQSRFSGGAFQAADRAIALRLEAKKVTEA